MAENQSSKSALAAEEDVDRYLRMLANLIHGEQVDVAGLSLLDIDALEDDEPDVAIAKRLTDAFHSAMNADGSAGDGLWEIMRKMFHGPILGLLEARDHEGLAASLAGMFHQDFTTGIAHRPATREAVQNDWRMQLTTADAIASLGMAMGLAPVPNPALAFPPSVIEFDHMALLEKIADGLDFDLAPPQAGGVFGVRFRGKFIPLKQLYQVYAARQMRAITGKTVDCCLEIGGGVGFLAYTSAKMGIASNYCIIDLPLVNLLQGYLLLKSDIADQVQLFGEGSVDNCDAGIIRILPTSAISKLSDKSFDLAVNQDSFPEMAVETMEDYFLHVRRLARRYLYSINHESCHQVSAGFTHGWVNRSLRDRPGFGLLSRYRYWMRPGYVEEVYEIS
jgi:hypothetical protein